MTIPVRVAVVGSDIGALSASVFLHSRGLSKYKIDHFLCDKKFHLNSNFLRNDKVGRNIVFTLFRDILNFGESEILVSNNFKLQIQSKNNVETIPSFKFVLSNLWSLASEPFRSQSDAKDVYTFIADRFGSRFANKYSNLFCRIQLGHSREVLISEFPKFFNQKSIMMRPFMNFFQNDSQKSYSFDFTDRLYQRLITGGPLITLQGYTLEETLSRSMTDWLKMSRISIFDSKHFNLENGYDIVIMSASSDMIPAANPDMKSIFTRTFRVKFDEKINFPEIRYFDNSKIIGIINYNALFDDKSEEMSIDVLAEGDVSESEILEFVKNETKISNFKISNLISQYVSRDAYLKNQNMILKEQNITDALEEANLLVNDIIERYANWPKFVENKTSVKSTRI